MQNREECRSVLFVLRNLHLREIGVWPRVVLSLLSAGMMVGLVMCIVWLIVQMWLVPPGRHRGVLIESEFAVYMILAIAAFPWLLSLVLVWQGLLVKWKIRLRTAVATLCGALVIVAVMACVGYALDGYDTPTLIVGLTLISGSCLLLLWVPPMAFGRLGKPITDAEDNVRVLCPTCGYSLIGLRECRCPECGQEFTLDEIIRRQDYGATIKQMSAAASPPLISDSSDAA